MDITFEIPSRPFGKARPRFGNGRAYDPKSNRAYEAMVRKAFLEAGGEDHAISARPISIYISACYPPPSRASKKDRADMLAGKIYPTIKPDLDNIAKSIMDALNGLAYIDDKQVIALILNKRYTEDAKTIVTIGEI